MVSLNNRLTAMEAVMGAYSRGVPIDFTPTYSPAIQAMEERIAAYVSLGGAVHAPPQSASVQPTDNHHDLAKAKSQPFSFSAPVDISFAGEEGLKVEQQLTPNWYSFEMPRSSERVKSLGVSPTPSVIPKLTKPNRHRRPIMGRRLLPRPPTEATDDGTLVDSEDYGKSRSGDRGQFSEEEVDEDPVPQIETVP
jgi:hypothetical protein